VNACCYVLRTGCAWRLLPTTFPPWHAVYKAFSRWVSAGVFEDMQDRLRGQWRSRMGRSSSQTAAVIDAQSNRISPQGGESGFDAGKKVKGKKRNLVVDTTGLVIAVTVTAASVQDRDAAAAVVAQACAKVPDSKSSTQTVHTAASALATSSSNTTFKFKSYGVRGMARLARCMTLRERRHRLQKLTPGSWSCQSAGSSSEPTRGLNAGVARSCITTARLLFRQRGYDWQRHVCCSIDSPIDLDFVYTLLDIITIPPCDSVNVSRIERLMLKTCRSGSGDTHISRLEQGFSFM
jgi:transposase